MTSNLVYLLHATDNQEVAADVLNFYANTSLNLVPNPGAEELTKAISANPETPIILLISDNFLQSISSMDRLSVLIQDPSEHLIPVLIEGRKLRSGTVDIYDSYPTKIDTIQEVMKYRDFWYEEWIRLRKRCNDASGEELAKLEQKRSIAKKISTNIGTFLRNLNGIQPMSWDEFSENDYQVILDHLGIKHLNELSNNSTLHIVENEAEEIQLEVPLHEPISPETTEVVDAEITPPNSIPSNEEKEEEAALVELPEEIENAIEIPDVEEIELEAPALDDLTDTIEEEIPVLDVEKNKEEELLNDAEIENEKIVDATFSTENQELEEPIPFKEPTTEILETTFMSRGLGDTENMDVEAVYENLDLKEVNDLDVLFNVAEAEAEEGDFENARRCYERILQLDPTNGRAMLWLARLLDKHFEDEKSKVSELYTKALFCNEESANLYYEYALHLKHRFQSLHRASDLLERAIHLNPKFDLAYAELADCQQKLGHIERGRANYLQACILNAAYQSTAGDAQYGVYREVVEAPEEPEEAVLNEAPKHPNSDKVVMVTGATSGIGQAVAELFAINGYKVIVTGRRAERLAEMKLSLEEQYGAEMQTLSFDVRDAESVDKALSMLPEAWRNIDILINNAGLAKGRAPIHEGNIAHWEQMIDTNLKGLLYLTRVVTPNMVERGKGFIINIGSTAGKDAYPNGNVYCATKAAVDMLTKGLRMDLFKHGVRVAAIHPGHVETEFAKVRFDGNEEKAAIYDNFSPLTAYDVAETVYFVATRPGRINIQDVTMYSAQQATNMMVDDSGKKFG